MAVEIMNFGTTLTLFRGVEKKMKQQIASRFNVSDDVLMSWLLCMNSIRNICAHHGRLWNRTIGTKPKIPKQKFKHPDWHVVEIDNSKPFASICVAKVMLNEVAPRSKWGERFSDLLSTHHQIPIDNIGMPADWRAIPFWNI